MVNIAAFLVRVILLTEEIYIIDQASSVQMAVYWPSSLFACQWTERKSRTGCSAVMREVVSSTPARPTLRVLK